VALKQAVSISVTYGWIDHWWEGGVQGLVNKPKSGRLLKADDASSCLLYVVIGKEQAELGYDFANWTSDRLRAYMQNETGIDLSDSQFRALLKCKGYRYRRPKGDLGHFQEKVSKAKAGKLLKASKKGSRRQFRTLFSGRNDFA